MFITLYVSRLIRYYKLHGFLMTIGHIFAKILVGIWVMARWRNPIREMAIKGIQRKRLVKHYSPTARNLIIFLTSGFNHVNGGILSINSIYNETCKLKRIHGADTVMCTMPGQYLLLKYTKFKNRNYLYSFSEVLSYFRTLDRLLIHIPELYVDGLAENNFLARCLRQNKIGHLYINILLQNIEKAPFRDSVERLQKMAMVTATTAHDAYTTPEIEEKVGCRLHKLSAFGGPDKYINKKYHEKESLMIVSSDAHELKSKCLKVIAKQFPKLRLQIINNIKFEEYKILTSKAKWAITFGEGLDGYFINTIFSGGIGFAVYNNRFFTEDYKTLRTVYPDYDTLINNICSDMLDLDNEESYTQYQREQFEMCAKYWDDDVYVNNVVSFYSKYYSLENTLQEFRTS